MYAYMYFMMYCNSFYFFCLKTEVLTLQDTVQVLQEEIDQIRTSPNMTHVGLQTNLKSPKTSPKAQNVSSSQSPNTTLVSSDVIENQQENEVDQIDHSIGNPTDLQSELEAVGAPLVDPYESGASSSVSIDDTHSDFQNSKPHINGNHTNHGGNYTLINPYFHLRSTFQVFLLPGS